MKLTNGPVESYFHDAKITVDCRKYDIKYLIYPNVLSIGTLETINFPFVPNGKINGF